MYFPRWSGVSLVLLALSLACGGSSNGPAAAITPAAPTAFYVLTASPASMDLAWQDPSIPPPDGYQMQARIGSGDYAFLPEAIPPSARQAHITFSPSAPERLSVGFRIRSLLNGASSPWVETTYQFPILPPGNVQAVFNPNDLSVYLSWTVDSRVATTATVLRRKADDATAPWTPLGQVDRSILSWVDRTATDGEAYQYGIQLEDAQATASAVAGSSPLIVPCRLPTDLQGVWAGSSIQLQWQPRSSTADLQSVYRIDQSGTWLKLADLDGSAASFQDPAPPAGLNWYWLEVSSPAMTTPIQTTRALVAPPMAAGMTLTALPWGSPADLVRQPDGVWWMIGNGSVGVGGTLQSVGATQDVSLQLPPIQSCRLRLDATGAVHAMGHLDLAPQEIGHVWTHLGTLQYETLDALFPSGAAWNEGEFLLAPDGTARYLAQEPHADGTTAPLLLAQKGPAGWVRSVLPTPWDPGFLQGSALTSDGTLLAGLSRPGDTNLYLGWWDASGGSGLDLLPGVSQIRDTVAAPWGETFLICQWIAPDLTRVDRLLRGGPGHWQGPEALPGPGLAWAADGVHQRVLGVVPDPGGTDSALYLYQGGTWTLHPLGFTVGWARAGAGPDGKFWVALKPDSAGAGAMQSTDPVLLLQEP